MKEERKTVNMQGLGSRIEVPYVYIPRCRQFMLEGKVTIFGPFLEVPSHKCIQNTKTK